MFGMEDLKNLLKDTFQTKINISASSMAAWNASSLSGPYTLTVVAVDTRGNTATGTVSFNIGNTATISGTIPQFKWMLVSTPVNPTPEDPISMYGSTYLFKIYRWNPEKADDGELSKYEYPAALTSGNGYWIKAYYNDMPFSYNGLVVDTTQAYTISLKTNQRGYTLSLADFLSPMH